jgi:hypothetical protein
MEWRMRISSADIGVEIEPLVDLADRMVDLVSLEEFGPSWWTTDGAVGLTVSTDTRDASHALEWAAEVAASFEAALAQVGHAVGVADVEVGLAED